MKARGKNECDLDTLKKTLNLNQVHDLKMGEKC